MDKGQEMISTVIIAAVAGAVTSVYFFLLIIGCLIAMVYIKDDTALTLETLTKSDEGPCIPLPLMIVFFTFPIGIYVTYRLMGGFEDNAEEIEDLKELSAANKRIRELEDELGVNRVY